LLRCERAQAQRFGRELEEASKSCSDERQINELNDIRNGLGNLKKISITKAVRELVYEALSPANISLLGEEPLTKNTSDKIVGEIYAIRSGLLHDGKIKSKTPLERFSESMTLLEKITPEVLLFHLNKAAGKRP
jgi:hypothetical protein